MGVEAEVRLVVQVVGPGPEAVEASVPRVGEGPRVPARRAEGQGEAPRLAVPRPAPELEEAEGEAATVAERLQEEAGAKFAAAALASGRIPEAEGPPPDPPVRRTVTGTTWQRADARRVSSSFSYF